MLKIDKIFSLNQQLEKILEGLSHRTLVDFSVYCAESVVNGNEKAKKFIELTKQWLISGEIKELIRLDDVFSNYENNTASAWFATRAVIENSVNNACKSALHATFSIPDDEYITRLIYYKTIARNLHYKFIDPALINQ